MNFGLKANKPVAKAEAVPTIGEQDFEQEVLRPELPVLLEFSAEWCQPCKTIAPEVASFAKEMEGKVIVRKVDIDRSPLLARELRIQSVPTFMLFAQGRPVDAIVGAVGKKKLREMVDPFLPRAEGALKAIELAQLMKEGRVVAVDTRDAAAFGRAHLPNAKHMPLEEIESRLAELHMMAAQPVLYCRSGEKTKAMAEKLAAEGVPVMFLEGGMLGWESEGLPIERG
jgi:thioredoxin 1/putative thioredoxin